MNLIKELSPLSKIFILALILAPAVIGCAKSPTVLPESARQIFPQLTSAEQFYFFNILKINTQVYDYTGKTDFDTNAQITLEEYIRSILLSASPYYVTADGKKIPLVVYPLNPKTKSIIFVKPDIFQAKQTTATGEARAFTRITEVSPEDVTAADSYIEVSDTITDDDRILFGDNPQELTNSINAAETCQRVGRLSEATGVVPLGDRTIAQAKERMCDMLGRILVVGYSKVADWTRTTGLGKFYVKQPGLFEIFRNTQQQKSVIKIK